MSRLSFLKSSKKWLIGGTCFLLTCGGFKILTDHVHILVNNTDSLPIKTFIHLPHHPPKKGEYTLINSAWYRGRLIKKIVAEAGERIFYDEQGHLWAGSVKIGGLHQLSKDGKELTPLAEQVIPEDHVFVHAPHPRSFDSRYEQLGLIHKNALQGRALPVM